MRRSIRGHWTGVGVGIAIIGVFWLGAGLFAADHPGGHDRRRGPPEQRGPRFRAQRPGPRGPGGEYSRRLRELRQVEKRLEEIRSRIREQMRSGPRERLEPRAGRPRLQPPARPRYGPRFGPRLGPRSRPSFDQQFRPQGPQLRRQERPQLRQQERPQQRQQERPQDRPRVKPQPPGPGPRPGGPDRVERPFAERRPERLERPAPQARPERRLPSPPPPLPPPVPELRRPAPPRQGGDAPPRPQLRRENPERRAPLQNETPRKEKSTVRWAVI